MRQSTPTPLTLEEHRELGAELRATRARLRELCRLVDNVYGPSTRSPWAFQKVLEAMDQLCSDLQTQVARDLPGYPTDGFYN